MSESVLPMFSSRSFIVSGLTFRSFIHFEFIFVYGVRKCSSSRSSLLNNSWFKKDIKTKVRNNRTMNDKENCLSKHM